MKASFLPLLPLIGLLAVSCSSTSGLTATVVQPVQPVLIRNDHNVVLQAMIDSKQTSATLEALEFSLAGTDSVDDLDTLEVFSAGPKPEFSASTRFGQQAAPATKVTITGSQPLEPGPNVFYLSCRLKPTADLSHKIAATVTSIRAGGRTIAVNQQPPATRHRIGIALRKHMDDNVHTYRIPALATGPRGTLYAVYDMRRRKSRDLQEDIDIGLSRSTDGGDNWEPVKAIMDMGAYGGKPQEENGVSDPGIVIDQKTNEIFVFAVWMWGKPGKHQWVGDGSEAGYEIGKSAQIMMVRSKDDGLTWTKPENMTRKLKKEAWVLLAPAPQQGINLPDGTLVMPVQGRDEKGETFATIMTSKDHGANWTVGNPSFSGGNECQAAQLSDGSIMLNMRNDHERFRAVFVTNDLGKTWQPHATNRNTLIEPNCNASLRRIALDASRHILLFSNPHTQKGRTHQTIQVSFDDGRTWPDANHLLLDEGRGKGYPSLSQIDPQHIGIVYEGSTADLVFEKIALSELIR
ncbi:MAG: exo-alpha-sialidase [Bryobacterales bacterium]|nr:exo-alpha-sialidase [Bryobacterales bacterium]